MINSLGAPRRGPSAHRARLLAAALAAALAGGLMAASPAGASAGQGVGSFGGYLTEVTCVAAADCWAFGQDSARHAVAEHWNGSAWATVPVASPPGAVMTYLPSVSCVSATDCWAVGQYVASARYLAYAEHWNGTAWSPVAAPAPSGSTFSLLISVSCASTASCWAVGSGTPATFMERWNGHAWAPVLTPGLGSEPNPERVSCVTATDCWVSGMHGNGPTGGTLIGHWTGGAWSAVPTPTSHVPPDGLLGISCPSASACMTVGSHGNARTLAERWNGSAWAVTPTGTARAVLYAVSCANPGSAFPAPALRARPRACMAVGGTNGGNGRVFAERWNGSAWHAVPAAAPHGGNSSLVGVSCVSAADCWGAGSYVNGTSDQSLIEHWNGTTWTVTAS